MNILLFSGSLRKDSLNRKLLKAAQNLLNEDKTLKLVVADLKELALPVYDGDIEAAGMPDGVTKLAKMVADADAIVIASPEYNGSIAAPLKNAIDWVSRVRPIPWEAKTVVLLGATPGGFGTIRALAQAKAPFEALGAYPYPSTFGLPKAGDAFDTDGNLKDEGTVKRLKGLLDNFITYSKKVRGK
jgi:chromate reductase